MKRVALVFAVVSVVAASRLGIGQGGGNPFVDHSDTGETVHVLPGAASLRSPHDTQPTVAPPQQGTAVFPASYGSGNLIDHGGLEIANAGFWAVYWNGNVANSTATSTGTSTHYATIQAQMTDFINSFPDNANWDNSSTDDYEVVQQYGSHAPIASTLTNWGAFVDTRASQSTITDSKLRSYLTGLFNAGKVPARNDTIYGIYLPPGMRITLQGGSSCSSFCGYHGHFSYGGLQIKYAAFPYLNCNACTLSGLTVADMLTIVTSHEIREAVTDPGDNNVNAWYDAAGYEADDKCAWHNLYQMTRGGFWVQPEYSNGIARNGTTFPGPGCVVPNR
jgi:hypothetical protein